MCLSISGYTYLYLGVPGRSGRGVQPGAAAYCRLTLTLDISIAYINCIQKGGGSYMLHDRCAISIVSPIVWAMQMSTGKKRMILWGLRSADVDRATYICAVCLCLSISVYT